MSVVDGSGRVERPSFFDGQRLTAADLAAVQEFGQQARWLHNRTLHDWGVVRGLVVDARPGDRAVTVQPGYGLDSEGREVVLAEARVLPVPAVGQVAGGGDGRFYLTAAYATDAELPAGVTGAGDFGGRGAVRRAEAPILRWQDPNERGGDGRYRRGLDLVLAAIQVRGLQITTISQSERRHVEPASRPFVVAGQTSVDRTPWEVWETPVGGQRRLLGITTRVDTSWAGFRGRPAFLASVVGERVLERMEGLEGAGPFPIDGFVEVVDPSPAGFTLTMLFPRDLQGDGVTINSGRVLDSDMADRLLRAIRRERRWYVSWLGVEA